MTAEPFPPGGRSFFRSRSILLVVILAVVLVALWVASELAIPGIAASYARREITKRYPDAAPVTASVKAFPALKLAFRKYDRLRVTVGSITLQDVRFSRIELESTDWPDADFRAAIGQDEIMRFFSLQHSYVMEPRITIVPGGLKVTGKVDVGLALVNVSSVGALECADGRNVYFRPDDIQVSGARVPGQGVEMVRRVMDDNPVFVVRQDLPYTIEEVGTEAERVIITGRVDLEKALNIRL